MFSLAKQFNIRHINFVAMRILPSIVNLESSLSTFERRPAIKRDAFSIFV